MEISGFFGHSVVSCNIFLEAIFRGVFCWSRCWDVVLLRGHVMFGRNIHITQQTVSALLLWFSLQCFLGLCWCSSSVGLLGKDLLVFADFHSSWLCREKTTKELLMVFWLLLAAPENLWWFADPLLLLLLLFCPGIELLLLICIWCFGLACRYPDNKDCNHPK